MGSKASSNSNKHLFKCSRWTPMSCYSSLWSSKTTLLRLMVPVTGWTMANMPDQSCSRSLQWFKIRLALYFSPMLVNWSSPLLRTVRLNPPTSPSRYPTRRVTRGRPLTAPAPSSLAITRIIWLKSQEFTIIIAPLSSLPSLNSVPKKSVWLIIQTVLQIWHILWQAITQMTPGLTDQTITASKRALLAMAWTRQSIITCCSYLVTLGLLWQKINPIKRTCNIKIDNNFQLIHSIQAIQMVRAII